MPMSPMVSGMRIAGRFVIERPASAGGMGAVFRALDLQTGLPVALKLLRAATMSSQNATRLELEAGVLAKLQHPQIVSYIAHGRTGSGHPYLAMEWLSGEDLSRRLRRELLSLQEAMTLLRLSASALAAAHACGITHRDIKPSNLFLVDNRIDQIKLLDFGIAREELSPLSLTRTGSLVGTPDYMAPEQARGAHYVGPSADIFSLGCVFIECLTGMPPLRSACLAEQLPRVLATERLPLPELPSAVPSGLSALLSRMLTGEPDKRPKDGAALLHELDRLGLSALEDHPARSVAAAVPFSHRDQRLLCAVLAGSPATDASGTTLDNAAPEESRRGRWHALQETLALWGLFTEWLVDGSLLVTLCDRGSASDLAVQGARVAHYLCRAGVANTVAVATGLGVVAGESPGGAVIEQVLDFMYAKQACEPSPAASGIWLDALTTRLIDPQFHVRRVGDGLFQLLGPREYGSEVRPLAGSLTPCVGRERELGALAEVLEGCIDESMARAVLVGAKQGLGKSRLRHELLKRLRVSRPELTVLLGRGDPLRPGASGGVLIDLLRSLRGWLRLHAGPAEAAREDMLATLQRLLPEEPAPTGAQPGQPALEPWDGLMTPPAVFPEAAAQGLVQLLLAVSRSGPLLLIIEDLQWADARSVRVVGQILSALAERPLLVLGLTRPEVHTTFPKLWAEHRVQEMRLEPLLPSACEELLGAVLGPQRAAAVGPRVLQHAGGIPLFLEELIIESLDETADRIPLSLTVLSQGSLLRLPLHAQRVLRAASVFGMDFWEEGLFELLAPMESSASIKDALQILIAEGLISRKQSSRHPHTAELCFRQERIRAAALGLLTEAERARGSEVASRFK